MSLILILISSGTLLTPTPLPPLDPPQYENGVYNRSNDLRRIALSLARFDSLPGVSPPGVRELWRERHWVFSHVNSDQHYLSAQQKKGVEAMSSVADELHLKWQALAPSNYVAVMGRATTLLLDMSTKDSAATAKAAQFGVEILTRLPAVPLDTASLGASYLLKNHALSPDNPAVVALDLLPRAEGLNGVLAVMARVEDFMSSFSPKVEQAKLPEEVRRVVQAHAIPLPQHGEFLEPKDLALYLEFVEKLDRHSRWSKPSADPADRGVPSYQVRREKDLAGYIQRRYTFEPADLDEVQLALDKHVKDPALKERLVLAAYKGTNPFVGRTPSPRPATKGNAKPDAVAAKAAETKAAVGQSVKSTAAPSAVGQPPVAAEAGPVATASVLGSSNSELWAAFAGAAALILFVLWRAQARGNAGRGK